MTAEYRYPFGPYPTGWYFAMESAALAPGAVVPLQMFGRELVAFRTEGGTAVVLDAHCPHMGAHVGYGGKVDGECVRCPFHAWAFDTAGRCQDVPYDDGRRPPKVGLGAHHVHETSGLILVFHSDSGAEPAWRMPDLPEWGHDGWVGYETVSWRIRMHVQELAENIPDMAHFATVHGVRGTPKAEIDIDGHVYRQRSLIGETGETFTSQEAHGLGLVWLRSGDRIVFLTATTPIDDQYVDLRLLFLVNEGPGATEISPQSKAMVDAIAENTGRDVPIWEHKVYRERAPLVRGDGPINELRRWARQFHETDASGQVVQASR